MGDEQQFDKSDLKVELSPEQVLDVLLREGASRRRRGRIGRGIVFAYLGVSAAALVGVIIYGTWDAIPGWFFSVASFGGLFGLLGLAAAGRSEKQAALDAAQLDDVRFVGPLLEALHFQDRRLKQDVIVALISLLPRVRDAEWRTLTSDQRACLYRALMVRDNKLQFQALATIERIGDCEALRFVKFLLEPYLEFFLYPSVERAARSCIASLEAKVALERETAKLLRPSDVPAQPDALLRAADHSGEVKSEELLRASVQE